MFGTGSSYRGPRYGVQALANKVPVSISEDLDRQREGLGVGTHA